MTSTAPDHHLTRVPAEHRVLGLDRRTLLPALVVTGVFLLLTVVVPRIDTFIRWDDSVRAGERFALADTIDITPITGWSVESGFRLDEESTSQQTGELTVTGDGVSVDVFPGSFDGTPAELLEQTDKVTTLANDPTFRVVGDVTTLTTASGETGVMQPYSSVISDGLAAAFVIDGTGLRVRVYGPPAQMIASAADVEDMLASIRTTDRNNS
ncbi:hypothetical protein [Rhodococcus sp. NBC_00294]|uniref:hypothetical protein n=1 Tax=Rhodococcus sp. NBC_00294 TaxID=2976004 RepID=UPI002E28A8BB|nr:hypothetical protein [Rhodococcus sp. NBC_00294]